MGLPINYEKASRRLRRIARLEYTRLQGGKCHYCGYPLDGDPDRSVLVKDITPRLYPENFFDWPVHLHHCRKTGMSIGAVHAYCNAVLWEYHGE